MMAAFDITWKWEVGMKRKAGEQYFHIGRFPVHKEDGRGSYRLDIYLKEKSSNELEFHVEYPLFL